MKWTKETCKETALKYTFKQDFYKNSHVEVSLKYNNKKDFIKNEKSAYNYAHRVKIFDEICSHMNKS
jgi:hypothetical protein